MIITNFKDIPKWDSGFTFVSGCFDLIHPGHLDLLNYAASFGKKVVIALNTKQTICQLKGKNPIFSWAMRASFLDKLKIVAFVIPLEDVDSRVLVRELKPKIWALGSDHAGEDFKEFKSIKICFLKRDYYSSTKQLEHIREYLCGNG